MLSRDFKKLLKGKKAFTLIEVMIVIAIITVMTGFIAPSATVMRERGRQINRMNIARTIYLSMQNQLTKEMVGGSLKTILTGPFYETDENGFFTDRLADGAININNVAQALSANLDQDINDVLPPNEDITLVRFISKPRNYDPFAEANEGNVLLNNFFNLLSEIILDREILNDAILMEYNISTGVVLSIFYGDDAEQTLLTYMDIDDNDRNNVTGGRGVNNYWQASERRQGYYGVDSTGVLPPVRNIEQANIYDGIETGRDLDGRVNVLYAEFLLEAQDVYTFEVLSGDTSILTITMNPDITPFPTDFANALLVNNGNIIFQPGMQGDLFRYIWVIDFTDGNINQPNSVGERIRGDESPINLGDIDTVGEDGRIDFPSQVRVRASRDGNAGVTSRTSANLFYDREINGNYEIRTARHLNNVRYLPDRIFRQTEDIDMARPWGNVMNNFAPIRNFSGRYSAMSGTSSQFRIENLRIDIPDTTENRTNFGNNIGLFADPSGDIQGIALFAATINARYPANVGAIAGQLASGGRIRQSYSYANIDASNGNGNSNTGGLVGHIVNNGSLEQSFNAGFYNTATSTETENDAVRGSVMADRGNIGGLVGWNDGLIHNSFNNARVNTTDVELVGMLGSLSTEPVYRLIDGVNYGGIAGRNSGIIRNTYATNFVPFIPLEESVLRNIRSGGIAGRDDGTLIDNFYITNGNRDQGSRPKTDLMEELLWANSAFRRGQVYIEGTNTYLAYPYPILRSNNPFPFILPAELWGYEDIEDFEDDFIFGNLEFSYYERYDDGNFSFSPGGTIPLATDGIVTNDGYVLEFNFTQAMGLSINGISFELNAGENLANWTSGVDLDWNWEWTPINGTQVPLNKPVQVGEIVILDDDGNEIIVPNFRMFFENNFLEEFANGAEFINFSIINPQTNAVFREFSFNPLFADTINRTFHTIDDEDYNFVVRSPRHAANIGLAPASTFVQTLDIDFGLYFRTLIAGRTFGELIYIDLTSQPVFVNSAVINTPFLGDYNGNGHEIRNVVANNGLFHIVGDNARVRRITLRDATITYSPLIGGGPIGGIAAINFGLIELSAVIDSLISSGTAGGENIKVGGIVGENHGEVRTSSFQSTVQPSDEPNDQAGDRYSAVRGTGEGVRIGGIVGDNVHLNPDGDDTDVSNNIRRGVIEDVFFLSTLGLDSDIPPVSDNGGGIAGHNSGAITRAFYFAPSPSITIGTGNSAVTTIYPIVRSGEPAMKITAPSGSEYESCFYLAGNRYSVNEGRNWIDEKYNLITNYNITPVVTISGGGRGLVSNFVDVEWIDYAYRVELANWLMSPRGYPYPIIRGTKAPLYWPLTDSPVREDQIDTDDWANWRPTSERPEALGFVNGDFSVGNFTSVNDDPGSNRRIYIDMDSVNGWYTRPVAPVPSVNPDPIANAQTVFNPIFAGNQGNPARSWRLIELQEPVNISGGSMLHDYAYSNYQGQFNNPLNIRDSRVRYAELNAEVQGTLYQISPTMPGAEYYYSFYHTSRTPTANTQQADRMHFYLTGIADNAKAVVENGAELNARDGINSANLTFIRPAVSPRMNRNSGGIVPTGNARRWNSTVWNTAAWNTVAYGASNHATNGYNLNYHQGKNYLQPRGNQSIDRVVEQIIPAGVIYLYDVWVGPPVSGSGNDQIRPEGGYGITFWSTVNVSAAASGSNTAIPLAGITHDNYNTLINRNSVANTVFPSGIIRTHAVDNVIGYWGVEHGWKHYYGLYEVPAGQVRTEFAFQSRTSNPTSGNFLDGISFKSPSFLSIEKYIKDSANNNVMFVKPNDSLTVELQVKNFGEMPADNIVLKDRLTPFDQYIAYNGTTTTVQVTRRSATGVVTTFNATTNSIANINSSGTVVITLPPGQRLQMDEELTVRFPIRIRNSLMDDINRTVTLLYYFRNQGVVEYREDGTVRTGTERNIDNKFTAYKGAIHSNGSGPDPVQVFIDPIKLTKMVNVTPNQPLIDGPFNINLRIENTMEANNNIVTRGLITDIIPNGFRLAPGSTVERRINGEGGWEIANVMSPYNPNDGTTRITISNVDLNANITTIDYRYTLIYIGNGFGVSYIDIAADYKYLYQDEHILTDLSVMLKFPQPVVGISIKTTDDNFDSTDSLIDSTLGGNTYLFDITRNADLSERLADDNYDVMPEIVLVAGDQPGQDVPLTRNGDGNYWIDTATYTAILIQGTNNLEFTPKTGFSGSCKVYYQVRLTATKPGSMDFNLSSKVNVIDIVIP